MRKRVLVTGGAGFLGSHLCTVLLNQGCEVLCVDNFFTGARGNLDELLTRPNFEVMRHDVTIPLYVEVDEIYNLACPASPIHYQHDPVHTTKTSVMGAINALGLAKRLKVRILQASTSEVYGDPEMHPQHESYRGLVNIAGPRACYDEGKRCAETLFYDYHRQHNLKIRIARIFNTYGPKMHPNDGRVISNFIVQALKNAPITIYGDGSQTRSFCFVDDLVDGVGAPHEFLGRLSGAGQSGQPGGDHHQGGRRRDHIPNRFALPAGISAAARGRSEAALPRYFPRTGAPKLATASPAQDRVGTHHRVF